MIRKSSLLGFSRRYVSSIRANDKSASDTITIRIVSINDVYDLTKLPNLATLVSSLKNPRPSAVTLAGDFLGPSPLSSLDGGRGHVCAFRAAGITHVSLGNHEADPGLDVLRKRLSELTRRNSIVVLNGNVNGLGRYTQEYDLITSNCKSIQIALTGLLGDEKGMFRDGTFRGLKIEPVKDKYQSILEKLKKSLSNSNVVLLPLTHQSLPYDIEFAEHILRKESKHNFSGIILGGHEHHLIHETVKQNNNDQHSSVQIVKTGQDADTAAIVDLIFQNDQSKKLLDVKVSFENLDESKHPACPLVNRVVRKHLSLLDDLKDFPIIDTRVILSQYFTDKNVMFSSTGTRFQQTTVGAFFAEAIKSELGADVCIINGAPIKGSKNYPNGTMSYSDLQKELPFPLKMVTVKMTRKQLNDAIHYSRTNVEDDKPAVIICGRVERRGFLQTDFNYWKQNYDNTDSESDEKLDENESLVVALPRNLMAGFCKIQPLIDLGNDLQSKNTYPQEDDYQRAFDLIVSYCSKKQWAIICDKFEFKDLDLNNDGILDREEIKEAVQSIQGYEPSDTMIDELIQSIDTDSNGVVDQKEFKQLLASFSKKR